MNVISLCSGIGGLELGLDRVFGTVERLLVVERESFVIELMAAKAEAMGVGPTPCFTDLCSFGGRPCRGRVDWITAGFPCQPASVAGLRKGTEDERWIWPDIARIIREAEPRWVLLENVRGLLSANDGAAFAEVLRDLANAGFNAEWGVFSPSEAGAPHRRERVFILAYRRGVRGGELATTGDVEAGQGGEAGSGSREDGILADPASEPEREPTDEAVAEPGSGTARTKPLNRGDDVGDTNDPRLEVWLNPSEPNEGRSQRAPWPPGPGDSDGWRDYIAAGGPEPAVRRGADGLPHRNDRLRALGNAVVPAQAEIAIRELWRRMIERSTTQ